MKFLWWSSSHQRLLTKINLKFREDIIWNCAGVITLLSLHRFYWAKPIWTCQNKIIWAINPEWDKPLTLACFSCQKGNENTCVFRSKRIIGYPSVDDGVIRHDWLLSSANVPRPFENVVSQILCGTMPLASSEMWVNGLGFEFQHFVNKLNIRKLC